MWTLLLGHAMYVACGNKAKQCRGMAVRVATGALVKQSFYWFYSARKTPSAACYQDLGLQMNSCIASGTHSRAARR